MQLRTRKLRTPKIQHPGAENDGCPEFFDLRYTPRRAHSCNLIDNHFVYFCAKQLVRWSRQQLRAAFFRKLIGPTAFLLISTLFSASLGAQDIDLTMAQLIAQRPDASGTSTEVTVGVFLIDIDEIDDVSQRFTVDMFVNIAWRDPRLALPENAQSRQVRSLPLSSIWTPRGLIVNDRGLSPQLPLVADVDAMGNVVYRQRLSGELAADLNFKNFPFDTQRLPIDVVSYQYSPDEIRFSPAARIGANLESFSVEGWQIRLLETSFDEFAVPAAGIVRPRLTFAVEAQRNAQYYVLTMFLPVSLIVFMSWTAFWIQPNVVPPRIAISTASIFSLIALSFSIRLGLPRISYVTRADLFVIGCTLLVFIALGIAVVGSRWAGADKMDQAIRLNAITRWVYVVLFFVVAAVAATI